MNQNFHIFLLIGQSNMAGRGEINDVSAIDDQRILMYRSGKWITAKEPLHLDKPEITGIGLGMSFAEEILNHEPDITIGLIPCAVGWTSLSDWMPGTSLFKDTVSIAQRALTEGVLKGILWHQGENDTFNKTDAEKYGLRLSKFISKIRYNLDAEKVPFIVGKLAGFLEKQAEFKFLKTVNMSLDNLKKSIQNYGCVNVDGLKSKNDHHHFNSKSLRELGIRYSKMYFQLRK